MLQFREDRLAASNCILHDRIPVLSGEEGMQDVRIVESLHRSAKTGRSVKISWFANPKRPSAAQTICRQKQSHQNPTLRAKHWMTLKVAIEVGHWRAVSSLEGRSEMARYGKKAAQKVERAMHKRKRGTLKSGRSGKKATSRKQAIAIGLSEARKSGAKVPRKSSRSKKK
jgi:hypothetical protein